MSKRENEGKKEKKQKKERKEKRKQDGGLYLNPVSVPRARTCAHTCASACVGAGAGAGAGAREGASRSGSGAVDIRHGSSGAGSANRIKIDRDFIMDPAYDAVQVALLVLRIPEVTPGYNNARLMRWALRNIGEEEFRDLVYRQWRENALDGYARNAAAAFQAKLNCAVFGPKGGAR